MVLTRSESEHGKASWRLNIYGRTGRDDVSQLTFMLRRPKRLGRARREEENLSISRHGGRLGGGWKGRGGEGLVRQNCEGSISGPAGARIKTVERKGVPFLDPCAVSDMWTIAKGSGRSAKRNPLPGAWVSAAHPTGTQFMFVKFHFIMFTHPVITPDAYWRGISYPERRHRVHKDH